MVCNPDPLGALYCHCPLFLPDSWEVIKPRVHCLFSLGLCTINSPCIRCVVFSPTTLPVWMALLIPHLTKDNSTSKHSVPGGEFFHRRSKTQPRPGHKSSPRTRPWWMVLNVYLELHNRLVRAFSSLSDANTPHSSAGVKARILEPSAHDFEPQRCHVILSKLQNSSAARFPPLRNEYRSTTCSRGLCED